ncbi:brachyurin-like [Chrysoperla carnea]|uniref:brachyurin-like n=1 Tax=Chrysoperla carnea TaxID=189513 RepID=UPI001D067A77|nr:brachyurin-like [Chrysoperla carnea]
MKNFIIFGLLSCICVQAYEFDWDNVQSVRNSDNIVKAQLGPFYPHRGPEGRVVGGNEVTPHKYPHQVAILLQLGDKTAFCGGSLISKRFVLTAAHCAKGVSNFTVILGAHNVKENEPTQQVFQTTEKIVHPQWPITQFKLTNDIALIVLPQDAELNENVQVIRLPSRSQVNNQFISVEGTVSGWGKDTDAATSVSPVLREASNKIISNTKCNTYLLGIIEDSHVCLSGSESRGACNGDSGGPLVITDFDGKLTQVGLVSFGLSLGCENSWPSAYTRLTSFLDFIASNSDVVIRE